MLVYIHSGLRIQHQFKFLPAYSPQLNPIEECFATWKHYIKIEEKRNVDDVLELIDACADKISPQMCEGYYNHCMRYYVDCAAGRPLRGDGNDAKRELAKQLKLSKQNSKNKTVTTTSTSSFTPSINSRELLIDEENDICIEGKYDDEDIEIDLTATPPCETPCDHRSLLCTCITD